MPKYVAFLVPDTEWDGIGYLYDLINLKPNDRHFALVTAKNMEQARKKYFTDYLYPLMVSFERFLSWQNSSKYILSHPME